MPCLQSFYTSGTQLVWNLILDLLWENRMVSLPCGMRNFASFIWYDEMERYVYFHDCFFVLI